MLSVCASISNLLLHYRRIRAFDPDLYLQKKSELLLEYFNKHAITTALVGVSGGVDSSVVLAILRRIQDSGRSSLKRVVGVLMPVHNSPGATKQLEGSERGAEVITAFGAEKVVVDLSAPTSALKTACDHGVGDAGKAWACGQLVSYIRTPAIYYLASVYNERAERAVVCGTTNRDEGAYIGFFGKASDGMVDLQIISDLHKSEVYKLARKLKVPESVLSAPPSGDVYDGKIDEEMIGAPYDFLELYQSLLCDSRSKVGEFVQSAPINEREKISSYVEALETLHLKNLHKYLCGSAAIHFDVYERAVPGGWKADIEISETVYQQIRNDPYYRAALPFLKTDKELTRAGFFLESGTAEQWQQRDAALSWYATPLSQIRRRLEKTANSSRAKVVLITTGAFCPVHSGHIHMMESAKSILEDHGYDVLGGFLSPSHDEYVDKKCGKDALSAAHRIELCREAIRQSDWLGVDTWESLYAGRDVNFTKTVWRLSEYLRLHLKRDDIEVFYVCGGDNACFILSFIGKGGCVVIPREKADLAEMQKLSQNRIVASNPKLFLATNCAVREGTSSEVRAGKIELMEPNSARRWIDWRKAESRAGKRAVLTLRDEGSALLSAWKNLSSPSSLEVAHREFRDNLLLALQECFHSVIPPDSKHSLQIDLVPLASQLEAIAAVPKVKTVSIDPLFLGDYNIGCSRHFELGASWDFLGVSARPGWPDLSQQIKAIPSGCYTLVDDDCATGATTEAILKESMGRFDIAEVIYLSKLGGNVSTQTEPVADTIDLGDVRDFLPGTKDGGLVLRLPSGGIGRAPYLLPYVQPSVRISAPISCELFLSKKVWDAAAKFYSKIKVTVDQSDPSFRATMQSLGLEFHYMSDLCAWHSSQIDL